MPSGCETHATRPSRSRASCVSREVSREPFNKSFDQPKVCSDFWHILLNRDLDLTHITSVNEQAHEDLDTVNPPVVVS